MSICKLIFKELWHRKWNALLSIVGLTAAVAVFIGFRMTSLASQRETVRIQRDMGFNLRIIPKDTDMVSFWNNGFSDKVMPYETVDRLAKYDRVFMSYNHLSPSLQGRYQLADLNVLLMGLGDTIAGEGKKPMGFKVKPGTIHLGYQVARQLSLKKGDTLMIGPLSLQVSETLVESGTDDDIRIFASLSDVQQVLNKLDQINEIKAIDCLCLTSDQDPLTILRDELKNVIPEAEVLMMKALADTRARQRQMTEKYLALMTPAILIVCGTWLGTLAMLNVRERRGEIGVYRALGKGSRMIAGLILGKALVLGVAGAILGFGLGQWAALEFGPRIFTLTAKSISPDLTMLWIALLVAPLFSALASFIPAALAVRLDPVENLRNA